MRGHYFRFSENVKRLFLAKRPQAELPLNRLAKFAFRRPGFLAAEGPARATPPPKSGRSANQSARARDAARCGGSPQRQLLDPWRRLALIAEAQPARPHADIGDGGPCLARAAVGSDREIGLLAGGELL